MAEKSSSQKAATAVGESESENYGAAAKLEDTDSIPEISIFEPSPNSTLRLVRSPRYFSPFQSASPSHTPPAAPIVLNAREASLFPKIPATLKAQAKKIEKKPPLPAKSARIAEIAAPKPKTPNKKVRRRTQPNFLPNYMPQYPPFYPYPPPLMQQAFNPMLLNQLKAYNYQPYMYPYAAPYQPFPLPYPPLIQFNKAQPPHPYSPLLQPPTSPPKPPPRYNHNSNTRINTNNDEEFDMQIIDDVITENETTTDRTGTGSISPDYRNGQDASSSSPKSQDYPVISGQKNHAMDMLYNRPQKPGFSNPPSQRRRSRRQVLQSSPQYQTNPNNFKQPLNISQQSNKVNPTAPVPIKPTPPNKPATTVPRPLLQLPTNPVIAAQTAPRFTRANPLRPSHYQRQVEFQTIMLKPSHSNMRPPQPSAVSMIEERNQYPAAPYTTQPVYNEDTTPTAMQSYPRRSPEQSPQAQTAHNSGNTNTPVYKIYP